MRFFMLICWLFGCGPLYAQNCVDNRFTAQLNFGYNNYFGEFNSKSSNSTYLGQVKNGFGANVNFTKPIYKGWGTGIFIGTQFISLDREKVRQQLIHRFNPGNEYFMTTKFKTSYTLSQIAVEFFKIMQLKSIAVRPFVRLGFGNISDLKDITIYLKKKNDNYFENYSIKYQNENNGDEFNFFYSSVGTDVSFPVNRYLGISIGAMYNMGKAQKTEIVSMDNLFKEKATGNTVISQSISCMQFFAGLQMKIGKQ